jgi:chemotaxis protein methyltransferase CheR
MTINETSFFRDVRTFETIRNVLLPRMIEARRAQRTLRIWSAACSTGQEAASIAMLLSDRFPEVKDWDVRIIGTDIADNVLERAQKGRYRRNEINRGLPARLLLKYFTRYGDEWELDERLRRLCEFTHINLCAPLPVLPQFDLVLLRNVLLYFSPQDRTCVLNAAHRLLASDGYLVLGAAEQAEDSTDLFEAEFGGESFFYRSAA